MASRNVVRLHSDGRWPVDGFTSGEARTQAAAHQVEREAGRAFTFLLLDPSQTESLGCLYLNPLRAYPSRVGTDPGTLRTCSPDSAMITFWVHRDQQWTGFADVVARAVNAWVANAWPPGPHLFRILPGERSSRAALEELGLRRVGLRPRREGRPYLWYQADDVAPEPTSATRHITTAAGSTGTRAGQRGSVRRRGGALIRVLRPA